MAHREGVIGFELDHRRQRLADEDLSHGGRLLVWRRILRRRKLLGQAAHRYEGLGYGNLSRRLPPWQAPPGERAFLITASQTSGLPDLTAEHWSRVAAWKLGGHSLVSVGEGLPSSESLSHAALYDRSPEVRAVFHIHSPPLWNYALAEGWPATLPSAANGTPELALALRELEAPWPAGVIVLAGHEDGLLAYGRSEDEAGGKLLAALRLAI
ncbi:MAG: class II aldolase/adducin family protein [Acidobacteriota bacterium]